METCRACSAMTSTLDTTPNASLLASPVQSPPPSKEWSPPELVAECDIPEYPGAAVLFREVGDEWDIVNTLATAKSLRRKVCKSFGADRQEEIAECRAAQGIYICTRYVEYTARDLYPD